MFFDSTTVINRGWDAVLANAQNAEFQAVDRNKLSQIVKTHSTNRYPAWADWSAIKKDLHRNYGDRVAEKLVYSMLG
jgi:hypothetical protein